MTELQKDLLLAVLMHYATPDVRARLRAEVPEAYEAYWNTRLTALRMATAEHERIKAERQQA